MKFSETWLRQWVNPALNTADLMHQITMAGLEVDGVEPAAGSFSGVVVASIETAEQHPNADKLQVCTVNDGTQTVTVVCGAPNARPGIKVALAQVGGVLPGDFKIKKAKLRDVESMGMLCSGKELGLSDDHSGILELPADAPVGSDLRTLLALDDQVIDVDLTPNRADCLSLRGLAREVGVLNELPVTEPESVAVSAQIDDQFPVSISAPEGCPRYLGRVIRGINPQAATPLWMQERLRRSGVRSIDPVVDVTNYVMLELGQPMHGFDLDRLDGEISVRWAQEGEALTLLDEQTVKLTPDTLVIADRAEALAIAGVMGGERSGVNDKTRNIFLECAFFAPLQLAGKARAYGLHTDASHRFERGVDHTLQQRAMERATFLLLEIVGGQPGPITEAKDEQHLPLPVTVTVSHAAITQLLGSTIPEARITQIFAGLGFAPEVQDATWTCAVPSYRFDISIAADLIEEVARVYGYNNLPVAPPMATMELAPLPEQIESERLIKRRLLGLGYQEAITYSFVDSKLQALLEPELKPLALANPISEDLAVMRTSILTGLLSALQYNLNRQQERVRLFEVGLVFRGQLADLSQTKQVGGLVYGNRLSAPWLSTEPVDFYDLKGDVEGLLGLVGHRTVRFEPLTEHSLLHPGQAATVYLDGEVAGILGRLHPRIESALGLKLPVFVFELAMSAIAERSLPAFETLSRFPSSNRDIAVALDDKIPAQALQDAAIRAAGEWIADVHVFDVYTGESIGEGKRSVALQLSWQHPERTLLEEEIARDMNAVIERLQQEFGATLRG